MNPNVWAVEVFWDFNLKIPFQKLNNFIVALVVFADFGNKFAFFTVFVIIKFFVSVVCFKVIPPDVVKIVIGYLVGLSFFPWENINNQETSVTCCIFEVAFVVSSPTENIIYWDRFSHSAVWFSDFYFSRCNNALDGIKI